MEKQKFEGGDSPVSHDERRLLRSRKSYASPMKQPSVSYETPQMKALRLKIQEKERQSPNKSKLPVVREIVRVEEEISGKKMKMNDGKSDGNLGAKIPVRTAPVDPDASEQARLPPDVSPKAERPLLSRSRNKPWSPAGGLQPSDLDISNWSNGARPPIASGTVQSLITVFEVSPNAVEQDWKGKFLHASGELLTLKEKLQEVTEENGQLKSTIDYLKERESKSSSTAQQLKEANDKLTKELSNTKRTSSRLQAELDKFQSDLSQSKETYESISESLKDRDEMIDELQGQMRRLNERLHQMDKDRRVLHNNIQDLKGNIRVFCRVRPKISKESSKKLSSINYVNDCTMTIARAGGSDSAKSRETNSKFTFNKIFPPTASQADVFEELSLLVQSALEGYNVCVFAYGQTGSGKTYTMEGSRQPEFEGIIPRTVRHIFEEMKGFELLGWEYRIEVSFLEIYNEHIVDLLGGNGKSHDIKMADSEGTDVYVTNLSVKKIHCPEDFHECLRTAQKNRSVAATDANERSSRSHSVARIKFIGTHALKKEICVGNLNLVDLAGSERFKSDGAARIAETQNINKSLHHLSKVILALFKKEEHIPYRESKLTHLLMPSLRDNSKTLMLLNISPLDECYEETLRALQFARNVTHCKLGSVKKSRTFVQKSGKY